MVQHHLQFALRNMRRRAFYSAINIAGLAVGLAACWLIGLYVFHERSYDRFLPEADRICAVALELKMGEEEGRTTNTPPPLGPHLAADFPEIDLMARSFLLRSVVVKREEGPIPVVFNETKVMAVDTSYLPLFNFPMAAGSVHSALARPGGLVLSQRAARKYFGQEDPMGKSLKVNDRLCTITGIAQDLPATSSVQFDFLLPMADYKVVEQFAWSWVWLQVDTWVRLREAPTRESLAALEAKFPAMVHRYAPAAYERLGQDFEQLMARGDRLNVHLLPLKSLHLEAAGYSSRLNTLGDGAQVGLFAIIGGLILILACVNFMNLSTARSMKRAQEVSVRKALGSQRSTLVVQFLMEALMYSGIAMLLATVLAGGAIGTFNRLTGLELSISDLFSLHTLGFVLLLPLLTTLLGGLYPAFYLSGFKTGAVFKQAGAGGKAGHPGLRSGLVVFQFAVSLVLMLGSIAVYRQLEFAQKQSAGLDRNNVLIVKNTRYLNTPSARETFRQQLAQMPEVLNVTHSQFLPSIGSFGDFYEPEQGGQEHAVTQTLTISSFLTDDAFMPTMGLDLLAGRNFLPQAGNADSNSVILNETAVKTIGWEQPLGKWMRYPGNENQRFQVIGVVRDFHDASIKQVIGPIAIFHESSKTYQTWASYVSLRLKPGMEKPALEKVAALWKSAVPGSPFEYDFLDASFARLYQAETKTGNVLGIFTGLALFIGCLGLFALATFTAEQRTKEIGIRKVLGASVAGITGLLARDFLKLVLLAILIASPVAYYFMQQWLTDFAYRIDIGWKMFAMAGLVAIGIACLTVSFQSLKAALANPVKSLRTD